MLSRGQTFGRARSLTAVASVLFLLVIGATGVRAQDPTPDPSPSAVPSDTAPVASQEPTATPAAPTPTPATSADPTPTPTVTPAPASAEPAPVPAPTDACLDFTSRAEAQAFYESEGGPGADPHGLDPDGDGIVCDNLQDVVDTADANSGPALSEPAVPTDRLERTPPRNTINLVAQLECGLTEADGVVRGMGRFPVAGRAYYSDDWHRPRYTPTFHLHKGLDIFAAFGTPIRAPASGRITRLSHSPSSGGIGVSMEDDERNWYYFGHLQTRADGLFVGRRVETGTVLGYVGDTGNAKGGAPHVHMEIHRNGVPIPPKPIVDGWLDEAVDDAPECVRSGPDASPQRTDVPAPAPAPVPLTAAAGSDEPTILVPDPVQANSTSGAGIAVPLIGLVAASVVTPLVVRRRKRDEYSLIGW